MVDALLADGANVTVLDNFSTGRMSNLEHVLDKINVIDSDLSIKNGWEKHFEGVDWVIHLAALADIVPSIKSPETYMNSNVTGTMNVLQASTKHGVKRFVYAASSSCYGLATTFPTPETAEISPQYPYALSKHMGEQLVLHWSKVYGLPALSLRFFNVYGPRSRTSGTYGAMFGVFLAQKLAKKPFTIVGNGEQTRDFTFVTDVADVVVLAAKSHLSAKCYNVGSGRTISVNQIVHLLGGDHTYIPKRPGEPDCTFADTTLIERDMNWKAKIVIEDGVNLVLEQISYWKEAIVWTPETISKATEDWFRFLGDEN